MTRSHFVKKYELVLVWLASCTDARTRQAMVHCCSLVPPVAHSVVGSQQHSGNSETDKTRALLSLLFVMYAFSFST